MDTVSDADTSGSLPPTYAEHDLDSAIKVFQHYLSNRKDKNHAAKNAKVKALFSIANIVLNPLDKTARAQKRKNDNQKKLQKDKVKMNNTILAKRYRQRKDVTNKEFDSKEIYKMLYTEDYSLPDIAAKLHYYQKCYVCQSNYNVLHQFYSRLCPGCADFNWQKRQDSTDMNGKICIVTGARIKIGFCIALKLLRMGATVIITTRFPNDAALRYSKEKDFLQYEKRLHIYGLDFRDMKMVSQFCLEIKSRFKELHVLINNAAQTVRKPPQFYQHLLKNESLPLSAANKRLAVFTMDSNRGQFIQHSPLDATTVATLKIHKSAQLSQVSLLASELDTDDRLFPPTKLDADGQQVDLRIFNSWVSKLGSISTVEMVECHLINTFAPWTLISELLPLLENTLNEKFIVNVSAKEGQFYRNKTADHPHTNMAKASLNMLTRTCAEDLKSKQIYMTAVDTGWVTNENPIPKQDSDWIQPIDEWDGAMRVLHPVITGYQGELYSGVFLKDYKPSVW
ncbi:hypothetical protein HDV01_004406 [Terramyces sp. JEL0728]|nr:hypothetical protein HDV01_004406 [Terramyces sp. JEL0728]